MCVSARSLALWTSNPLEVVYCREGDERRPLQPPPAAPATSSSSPSPSSSSLAAATQPAPRQQQQQKQQLGPPRRVFTFAHGCTRGHLLKGEERFAVEWEASGDGSVWYEVTTFSKPDHPLAVLTYPLVRMYQAKFGRDSADAVARGVAEARK